MVLILQTNQFLIPCWHTPKTSHSISYRNYPKFPSPFLSNLVMLWQPNRIPFEYLAFQQLVSSFSCHSKPIHKLLGIPYGTFVRHFCKLTELSGFPFSLYLFEIFELKINRNAAGLRTQNQLGRGKCSCEMWAWQCPTKFFSKYHMFLAMIINTKLHSLVNHRMYQYDDLLLSVHYYQKVLFVYH